MNLNFIKHSWPLTIIQLISSILIIIGLMTYNVKEYTLAVLMMVTGIIIWIFSLFIEKKNKKEEIEGI